MLAGSLFSDIPPSIPNARFLIKRYLAFTTQITREVPIITQLTRYCQGKRLFIKDITHYLVPPNGKPATIAPSLGGEPTSTANSNSTSNSTTKASTPPYPYATKAEPANPTIVPLSLLQSFHFTFLIRHPRHSIPSYFRCTIPPLSHITGFHDFMPSEAGYDELRRVFDYLKDIGEVGPRIAGREGQDEEGKVSITVIDADDLLDDPEGVIRAYCKEVNIEL